MRGFKPQTKKAKGYADGGEVEDQREQAPKPSDLGSGMAAKAAQSIVDRRAQLEAALGYADGGKVVGPGTGISDDIKTTVPEGTFIMPADSTEQIGQLLRPHQPVIGEAVDHQDCRAGAQHLIMQLRAA